MLTTVQLLDLARSTSGLRSDYALSKALGVATQVISNWRNRGTTPGNAVAMRLGALCGLDPHMVVLMVNFERAHTEADREVWRAMLKHFRAIDASRIPRDPAILSPLAQGEKVNADKDLEAA